MALKVELLQQFETDDRLLNDADIRWILSTPVSFSEDSSSFMKECAKQVQRKAECMIRTFTWIIKLQCY